LESKTNKNYEKAFYGVLNIMKKKPKKIVIKCMETEFEKSAE